MYRQDSDYTVKATGCAGCLAPIAALLLAIHLIAFGYERFQFAHNGVHVTAKFDHIGLVYHRRAPSTSAAYLRFDVNGQSYFYISSDQDIQSKQVVYLPSDPNKVIAEGDDSWAVGYIIELLVALGLAGYGIYKFRSNDDLLED